MRLFGRKKAELRGITIQPQINKNVPGSCLISYGNTKVLCCATITNTVPFFLKGTAKGWITAEYGMLPCSTSQRVDREAVKGKQTGRTQEIQRLIGRSLRAIVDLGKMGERQIKIDCDVISADGGTRTAAVSGSYVAVYLALQSLVDRKLIAEMPILHSVSAVSCGICNNETLLDLDYSEDSSATVDANFIMAGDGSIIEIQATAEKKPFSEQEFSHMLSLAKSGVDEILKIQNEALSKALNTKA